MMAVDVVLLTVVAGFMLTFLTNCQVIVLPIDISRPRCSCWSVREEEADGFGAGGEFGAVAGGAEGVEGDRACGQGQQID
jgi:hypothetical protein